MESEGKEMKRAEQMEINRIAMETAEVMHC